MYLDLFYITTNDNDVEDSFNARENRREHCSYSSSIVICLNLLLDL